MGGIKARGYGSGTAPGAMLQSGAFGEQLLASGEENMPRWLGSIRTGGTLASQSLYLTYWTARKTETCTQMAVESGNTAAGATPTLVRFGVYQVNANESLTLLAAIANDTSILAAADTRYLRSFSGGNFSKVAGQRYATGILVVTAAALPTVAMDFLAWQMSASSVMTNRLAVDRRLSAVVTGQTDLPASIASGSLGASPRRPYAEVLP